MKRVLLAAVGAALVGAAACAAEAQTVYEPVQYQYGAYHEIYYGGKSPLITSNNFIYTPQALQGAMTARRYNAPVYPYPSPYTQGSGVFFSPYVQGTTTAAPVVDSFIFSDYFPYEEVGQFGYTVDDARNEAYMNVPRYQTMSPAAGTSEGEGAVRGEAAAPRIADPREKAMPLLNWAKNERGKNMPLYRALLQEARKYDPAAVAAFEKKDK
ncbi:MAG TPA: hypothetical protein VH253_00890 [Phycisphaerae bacterium]|nr:hypothetical protein [Phycisphaerae bacterium]